MNYIYLISNAVFQAFINLYPEINGFSMWSNHPLFNDSTSVGFWPFDCLIRPNTQQSMAFREVMDSNPSSFHSCVYFSDGSEIPSCSGLGIAKRNPPIRRAIRLSVYPNPVSKMAVFEWVFSNNMTKSGLKLFDIKGRLLRSFDLPTAQKGVNSVFWNGTDDRNLPLAPGPYIVQIGGQNFSKKTAFILAP